MKKLIVISLVVLGLGVVSCQKQDIAPNSDGEMEVPTWDGASSARTGNPNIDMIEGGDETNSNSDDETNGGTTLSDPTITGGEITDPDNGDDGSTNKLTRNQN